MDTYTKEKRLGRGSFGTVYLVRHKNGDSLCVLKEMAINDADQRDSARQEIRVLSRLDHLNIIRYLDSFESPPNLVCLVMEYCSGGDLQNKIRRQRGLHFDEGLIISWTRQLCSALHYVHSLNILHRDVKSGNVFLQDNRPDSPLKLGDFGVSKVLKGTQEMAQTCVGTPFYLSPEICDHRDYNCKSDIWGLGCIVYQLLCLRPPFTGSNIKELMSKIIRCNYPPMPPRYTYELRHVVTQMLRKNPDERPSADCLLRKPILSSVPFARRPVQKKVSYSRKFNVKQLGPLAVYLPSDKKPVKKTKMVLQRPVPPRRQWKKPTETLIGALSSLCLMDQTWTIKPAVHRSSSLQLDSHDSTFSDSQEDDGENDEEHEEMFQTKVLNRQCSNEQQDSPFHHMEAWKCRIETVVGVNKLKIVWQALDAAPDLETEERIKRIQSYLPDECQSTSEELVQLYTSEQTLYSEQ